MATDPADAASTAWTSAICSPIYSSYRGRTRAALVQQCQTERRTLQFAERNLWNIAGERMAYSALMLAARITLPHLSASSAMNFPNAAPMSLTSGQHLSRQAASL
jgi:hypothetical protein